MLKKWMMIALIALLVCMATQTIIGQEKTDTQNGTAASQSSEQKLDAQSFLDKFTEAFKANDQARMEILIKEADIIVCPLVILLSGEGIKRVAAGDEATRFFNVAEIISEVYAKVFKKDGLVEIVRRYKAYTQEMCKEKLKGDGLIKEGLGFFDKSNWHEAQSRWAEALKIYQKIGDAAGESTALNNIGNVYYSLDQYTETLKFCQQSLAIIRRIGDKEWEVATLANIGNAYHSLGQWAEALKYRQESLEISKKIGDATGEAQSLNNMGLDYKSLGQYYKALQYLQQSMEITHKNGNTSLLAKSLCNIGLVYECLGQYEKALQYLQQSLEIGLKIDDVSIEAESLIIIGNVYYKLSQYDRALHYYQQSLQIVQKIKSVSKEAESFNNIGSVYRSLGRYPDALKYHQQSLEIMRTIGDVSGEANTLNNVGIVYFCLGQYAEALKYYQQSLQLYIKIGDVVGESSPLGNIGILYNSLGQYTEAIKYFQRSLEISRKIGDAAGESSSLGNIGSSYGLLGQHTEALKYHQQSQEIAIKIGNVAGEGVSFGNIGTVYHSLGQYAEAIKYFQQSLEISRKIGDAAGESSSLMYIGNISLNLGQYSKSLQIFQESLMISETVGNLEIFWRSNLGMGQTLWLSGKPEKAVDSYEKAVATIEQLYTSTSGFKQEERSSMIGEKSFVYQEFIELLLELHRKSPDKGYDKQAFSIAEKGKSRTFQELMAKAGAKIALSGDEVFKKMVEKEQQLIRETTNLQGFLNKELSKPQKDRNQEVIASLKEQLSKAEKTLIDLEKEIDAKYPRYADLKRPKPLTVEDLQEILKPGEIVIAYAVGKEKVIAFVLAKDRFKLLELEIKPEELVQLIKEFRHGLENVHEMKDLEEFKPETAYTLYQKLMAPLLTDLKGITKLYIAADGILYTLPFEALVDQEMNKEVFREARRQGRSGQGPYLGEYATLHYLVDTYTITYLPSASMLRSLRKYEKPGYGKWTKPLIAFADPIFGPEKSPTNLYNKTNEGVSQGDRVGTKGISKETELTAQILTRSTGADVLERLKESAEEAGAIAKEVKGKNEDIYLRDKATEDNVYKTKLKEARYLLFSTHGLIGGDFKGVAEPALVLTLIDNPPGKDGFLCMSEVLGLDLNAELVILSACNTSGKGDKTGAGEGFVGLTRSFMYAGTRSILVTHWSVESQAARDLMVSSFKNMQKETRPEALKKAKLKMKGSVRDDKDVPNAKLSLSHPFFWAPFVLVGEGI